MNWNWCVVWNRVSIIRISIISLVIGLCIIVSRCLWLGVLSYLSGNVSLNSNSRMGVIRVVIMFLVLNSSYRKGFVECWCDLVFDVEGVMIVLFR